jgi:hypothetical protein
MVIQEKKNGKARRTVRLSYLSKCGLAESHPTPSAAVITKRIPGNKFKSTLDCVDGYHVIELEEKDRHKTTFATEWGKFRYSRAPQGYLSSGDSYSRHTDTIMEDCPSTTSNRDFEKIVDNIITHSDTVEGEVQICQEEGGVRRVPDHRGRHQACCQVYPTQHIRSEIVVWVRGRILFLQN